MPINLYSSPMKYKDLNGDYQTIIGISGNPGNGIVSITKTASQGITDTYTITYTNGTTETFSINNGDDYVLTNADKNEIAGLIKNLLMHICTVNEYNAETGIPTIQNPAEGTFYLVPGGSAPNLYIEWIYTNGAWERFGSVDVDLSGYATKVDTVLDTTLSLGRKVNTTIGTNSVALGYAVEASGNYSHAEGGQTIASGVMAHAEGAMNIASGLYSHVEGGGVGAGNIASGQAAHAEGINTLAAAIGTHTEGGYTIANGRFSHVAGRYNVEDSYSSWSEWVASISYEVGDKVKVTTTINNETSVKGYICKTANSDAEFTAANWTQDFAMNFAEIIGNGTSSTRSNARALGWDGNEYLAGDLYVHANSDSSGGSKVATTDDVSGKANKADTVLETTLSRGRKDGTIIGIGSFAFGNNVEASGRYSHAEGQNTSAKGANTIVVGHYNIEDEIYPNWEANTEYSIGDKVIWGSAGLATAVECIVPNSDATFVLANWKALGVATAINSDNAIIVGNGINTSSRSNAYALDWDGNGHFAGDVFVHATADSTGGDKLLTAADLPVESGSGIGSVQVRNFESSNVNYTPTASGLGAFAEGGNVVASGSFSHAEGQTTNATQHEAHAEGWGSTASGLASHAEGMGTMDSNMSSHAEGNVTIASGQASHAEGSGQLAASFKIKSTDDPLIYTVNRPTQVGDKIRYQSIDYTIIAANNTSPYSVTLSSSIGQILNAVSVSYIAGGATGSYSHAEGNMTTASGLAAHAEGLHTIANSNYQHTEGQYNIKDSADTYAHIVGNGSMATPSNAYALTWTGDGHYAGDVYVHSNADSSGGVKLATIADIPNVPVQDVQVNGVSALSNGVANVPIASSSAFGVVKINTLFGIGTLANQLALLPASDDNIKSGVGYYFPISSGRQHNAVFYGLSKVAGVDLANETVTLGTYPETSKAAIKEMLGVQDGLKVVRLI